MPYKPPEGFVYSFLSKDTYNKLLSAEKKNALYDAEILYMDQYFGQFMDQLKAWDLYDRSLIIVTSDHGELLGEHGRFGHGRSLTQQELQVPLLLKYPGKEFASNRMDSPVQLNDIFSIILQRVGIDVPRGIQSGVPPELGHPLIAEVYPLRAESGDGHWRAIFEGDLKYVWNSKGHHRLFDLARDPGELTNLLPKQGKQAERLSSKMKQYLAKLPQPGPASTGKELDDSTKKALKSLGYVN